MSLHVLLGPAAARKTGRLLDAHQQAARDGQTAWLVVPSGAEVAPFRRELLGLDQPAGAQPRQPTPYAELMTAPELERRLAAQVPGLRMLSQDQRRVIADAVTREAQRDGRLEALRPAARGGWLGGELITLADELTVTGDADDGAAAAALRRWGGEGAGRRARELAFLLETEAQRRAAIATGLGLVDRAVGVRRVVDALAAGAIELAGHHITFAGFDDLDPVQRHLVLALGRSAAQVMLALPYADGREALVAARQLVAALDDAGAHTEEVPFDAAAVAVHPALRVLGERLYETHPAPQPPPDDGIFELAGPGPDEELALVAEFVDAQLQDERAPVAPHRLAIVTADPRQHGPALIAALRRRGIPAHLAGGRSAALTPIVRGVIALLRAAAEDGRAMDVVQWLQLTAIDDEQRDAADRLDAEVRRRDARSVGDARGLWRWVSGQHVSELDELRHARGGRPGALERAIADLLTATAHAWVIDGATGGRPPVGVERAVRAAREAARTLEMRARLVEQAWNLTPRVALAAGLDDVRRVLEELRLSPEADPPNSVAILSPLGARTRSVDVLVVAAAQRGTFPQSEPSRRLLSQRDRAELREHGWPMSLAAPHADAERYLAYEVATRPSRALALAWHDGDGDGGKSEPSPLVAEVRRVVLGATTHRTLAAGHAARRGLSPARCDALDAAAAGPRHQEVVHERSPLLAGSTREHHAVRALQTASRCSAQWFVEQHLQPKPLDPDAAPLTAGRLRHEVLAEVVRGALEAGHTFGPEALPALEAGLRAAAARQADAGGRRQETLGERLLRERVVAEVEATLPALCGRDTLQQQPSEVELGFGTRGRGRPDQGEDATHHDGGRDAVTITRGDHTLRLSGRIDRLDLSPDGREVLVVDYKGANVEPYRAGSWLERRELQAGLYALVAEELTGARAVGSLYQPVPGPADCAPRGATTERLTERAMSARTSDVLTDDEWSALLDELVALAAQAAAAIDDGIVAPSPARCSEDGCRYPWLCRVTRG